MASGLLLVVLLFGVVIVVALVALTVWLVTRSARSASQPDTTPKHL